MLQQALSLRTTRTRHALGHLSEHQQRHLRSRSRIKPESAKEGTALTVLGDNRALTLVYAAVERFELRTVTAGIKATIAAPPQLPRIRQTQSRVALRRRDARRRRGDAAVDGVEQPVVGKASFGVSGLKAPPGGRAPSNSAARRTPPPRSRRRPRRDAGGRQVLDQKHRVRDVRVMWNTQVAPRINRWCEADASPSDGLLAHYNDLGVVAGQGPNGTTYAAAVAGNAKVAFTAVPTTPPTFNRKHPSNCPPNTIGYALGKAFRYVRLRFAVDGTVSEPYGLPANCDAYEPEASPSKIPVDGLGRVTLKGFGFAESQWLQCRRGDGGEKLTTKFVGMTTVECIMPPSDAPAVAPVGVTNAAASSRRRARATTTTTSVGVGYDRRGARRACFCRRPLHMLDQCCLSPRRRCTSRRHPPLRGGR